MKDKGNLLLYCWYSKFVSTRLYSCVVKEKENLQRLLFIRDKKPVSKTPEISVITLHEINKWEILILLICFIYEDILNT